MKPYILCGVIVVGLVALVWALPSSGDMSSDSYIVPTYVIDNGGAQSVSAGFINTGAIGQTTPIGFSQSESLRLRAGFIAQVASFQGCWDRDEDGYTDEACGGTDCDDSDPDVNPGVEEDCDNGIDDDCDGRLDWYDWECYEFVLELDADYRYGYLILNYTIATIEPATWSNYLILISPSVQVIPLWSISLPVIYPPIDMPISFPFPSLGQIGIYTGLFTAGGPEEVMLVWVNTG